MNPEDKNFKVTLSFKVEQDGESYSMTAQTYENLNYDYMQALQNKVLSFLMDTLLSVGNERMSEEGKITMSKFGIKQPEKKGKMHS